MNIRWIGQGGFIINTGECTVMVDPYLSNSVPKKRNMPIHEELFEVQPDVIICTHNHQDHLDLETLEPYLKREKRMDILCPRSAYDTVLGFGFRQHNYVLFNRHTQYSVKDSVFKAVKAEHSDADAIGVIISSGGRNIYITGDTLYNTDIFKDIDVKLDILFICINGEGNNMNMRDAARFSKEINAKKVMPVHWGMFDSIDPREFYKLCDNVEIPGLCERIYL